MSESGVKTYMYSYENEADFIYVFDICFKATHASELPMLFPTTLKACGWDLPPISVLEEPLEEFMVASWTSFVKYNNPNAPSQESRRSEAAAPRKRLLAATTTTTTKTGKGGATEPNDVQWVLFSNDTKPYMILNRESKQGYEFRATYCPFWESHGITPAYDLLPVEDRRHVLPTV